MPVFCTQNKLSKVNLAIDANFAASTGRRLHLMDKVGKVISQSTVSLILQDDASEKPLQVDLQSVFSSMHQLLRQPVNKKRDCYRVACMYRVVSIGMCSIFTMIACTKL